MTKSFQVPPEQRADVYARLKKPDVTIEAMGPYGTVYRADSYEISVLSNGTIFVKSIKKKEEETMHPSVIKLILVQLSTIELAYISAKLDKHKNNLEAIIRNKNWASYTEEVWKQDLKLTQYTLDFIAKLIAKRNETPPA